MSTYLPTCLLRDRNIRWWIAQHLRGNYRRLRLIEARFQDLCQQLNWIAEEAFLIVQLAKQIDTRLQSMPERFTKLLVKWMESFRVKVSEHSATIDAQQEAVLQEEIDRLTRDDIVIMEIDSLLEELRSALFADSQYAAERVYLDKQSIVLPVGSEEAVTTASRMMQLKRKQQQLLNSVIDSIKVGLEVKFNVEEEMMVASAAFPTDSVDLSVGDMHAITAELISKHHQHHHFKVSEFYAIFLAQPWVVQEAVEDVKIEEEIKSMQLSLDKVLTEVNALQARNDEADEEMAELDKKVPSPHLLFSPLLFSSLLSCPALPCPVLSCPVLSSPLLHYSSSFCNH